MFNDLEAGLRATGRTKDWKLDVEPVSPRVVWQYAVTYEVLNDKGIVLARIPQEDKTWIEEYVGWPTTFQQKEQRITEPEGFYDIDDGLSNEQKSDPGFLIMANSTSNPITRNRINSFQSGHSGGVYEAFLFFTAKKGRYESSMRTENRVVNSGNASKGILDGKNVSVLDKEISFRVRADSITDEMTVRVAKVWQLDVDTGMVNYGPDIIPVRTR
jgi:hypothetical protein